MAITFEQWLDTLLETLDLANAQIASAGDIDRSLISRYRSGVRVPPEDHVQLKKLLRGIRVTAAEAGKTEELRRYLGAERSVSLEAALYAQATSRLEADKQLPSEFAASLNSRNFSDRLTSLMDGLQLKNVRLAKALNIDRSLVSRWRNGMRLLKEDNPLFGELCDYLATQILHKEETGRPAAFLKELKRKLGTDAYVDEAAMSRAVREFLLRDQGSTEKTRQIVDEFIQYVLDNSPGGSVAEPTKEMLLYELNQNKDLLAYLMSVSKQGKKNKYQGLTGMREAVLRFLFDVVMSDEPRLLKLFSTQNMSWLVADPDFLKLWSFLMQLLLKQGHHIEIIHHFGRSSPEIMAAFQYWLPLYMSGNIAPYTCDVINDPVFAASPFTRTLFVNRGEAAISGEIFQGTEGDAYYRYITNADSVAAIEDQFDYLKEKSEPIASLYKGVADIRDRIAQYLESAVADAPEDATGRESIELCSALPHYLFPKEMLEPAIRATAFTDSDKERVLQSRDKFAALLAGYLEKNDYHLIAPLPPLADSRRPMEMAFPGLGLPPVVMSREFHEKIAGDLRRRANKEPHFHVHTLEIAPFDRLNLVAGDTHLLILVMSRTPHLLEVKNARVRESFGEYLAPFLTDRLTRSSFTFDD